MPRLSVKVTPKTSRNQIIGWLGDALKVTVTAPPEDGRANVAVGALLATALEIASSRVRCVAGRASSRKVYEINGLTEAQILERLEAFLATEAGEPRNLRR